MFRKFTTEELIDYVRKFKFTRKLTQLHIHHTYLPNYSNFKGNNHQSLQEGMMNYHINTNGWSTIGQNLTLFPDGTWLLGRDFNSTPASILGWNTGALAVELIGNFDIGNDSMTKNQSDSIHAFTEFSIEEMGLDVKFHRDSPTSYKTCPGTGVDKAEFMRKSINYTEDREKELKMGEIKKATRHFTDLVKDGRVHWAESYINLLADKSILKGIPNEGGGFRFEPDRLMTRAEMATVIAKVYEALLEETKKGMK